MNTPLTLLHKNMRCELVPSLGGCVTGLWLQGHEVLRHRPADTLRSGFDAASYPLLPYSNRVGYRTLHWAGQTFELAPNFPQEPHSIHGVGWMRPWVVEQSSAHKAVLGYRHVADAHWPFAFDATQTFTLDAQALEMHMQITNRADVAAPVGLGWHPYFAKSARTHIRFDSLARWDMGADKLPTVRRPHTGLDTDCSRLDVDHCFEGWTGALQLTEGALRITVSSDLSYLVVYTTPERDSIAIEPISHVNNALALSRQTAVTPESLGMRVLQPGETFQAAMRIHVERAA